METLSPLESLGSGGWDVWGYEHTHVWLNHIFLFRAEYVKKGSFLTEHSHKEGIRQCFTYFVVVIKGFISLFSVSDQQEHLSITFLPGKFFHSYYLSQGTFDKTRGLQISSTRKLNTR